MPYFVLAFARLLKVSCHQVLYQYLSNVYLQYPAWVQCSFTCFFYTRITQCSDRLYLLQGLVDMNKPPEMISGNMTAGKWNKNTLNIFNCSDHLSIRWVLIKQFHLVQPCASIQDSLWGLRGWCSRGTTCFWHAMHPMSQSSSTSCLGGLGPRGKLTAALS